MARGVNQVILVGYTTQDPEIRYTSDGKAIANITIATNEEWKDKNTGEKKSKAEYHRVVIFGKLAKITGEHVKKGFLLYASGQLQTRKWQDQSGQDRYTTEVVINPIGGALQILGARSVDSNSQQSNQPNNRPAPQPQNEPPMDFDDNIPF